MADKSIGTAFVNLKTKVDKNSQAAAFSEFGNLAEKLPGSLGGAIGKATALGSVFSKYGEALAGANTSAAALATTMAGGAGAIGATVGGMAATVAAANKVLEENASSWEALETKILTINGLVGGDQTCFDAFKEAIMGVASTTSWTAEQVADGMEALVRGGATAEQAIASISTVADLARSQVWDMGSSADLLSNLRNQFGLAIEDVTHIADVISATTASSAQNVSDFAEAMKMAGSTAGKMGQSLERTAAQVAALANVGIKGTMGGSAINALISRIAGNESTFEALTELGVKTHDESGNLRALDEILTDARVAMQNMGLSQEKQEALWTKIAGAENLKSALTLSQNYLVDIADTLRSVDGTTKKQAAAIDSGLKGSKEILESARDAITKQLGEAGAAGMKDRTDRITEAVGLAAEAAKTTSVNLERFSNATAKFGDISGDLEILKQEFINNLVSAAASIVEGLSPLIDMAHEILKILIDRDKLAAHQIANVNNKAKDTNKEGQREIKREAATRTFFESDKGKNMELTTNEGVKLNGKEAYEYATNRRKALTAKQEGGTALTEKETKEIESLSDFINEADETIAKVAVNWYDKFDKFLLTGTDEELKKSLELRNKEAESYKGLIDQYKPHVEAGEYKENDAYGNSVLKGYNQVIKNYSTATNAAEQIKAELALREQRKRTARPKQQADAGTAAEKPTPTFAQTIDPFSGEKVEPRKKETPIETPPETPKTETPPAVEPPTETPPPSVVVETPPAIEPPKAEVKLPENFDPFAIDVNVKIDTADLAKNQIPTFADTINPPTTVSTEVTDPAALNVLKQINDSLRDLNSKPATKTANM